MTLIIYTIILTFKSWDNTLECLESISANEFPNNHVIILYFSKTDQIDEMIRSNYPWVVTVQLSVNKGYAGNNNVGIKDAIEQGANWILILNDDTILAPDFYSQLLQSAEEDPRAGMLGPLVYHADEPKVIQSAGGYIDSHWNGLHAGIDQHDTGQYTSDREVDWLNGCAILCRADVLRDIGGMDERFFLYNEEVDLCLRVKQSGWKIKIVPGAKIWHKGVSRNYQPSPYVTYYMVRNHFFLLKKHKAPLKVKIGALAAQIRMIASYTLRPKWRHKRGHRDAAAQGLLDFIFHRMGKRRE